MAISQIIVTYPKVRPEGRANNKMDMAGVETVIMKKNCKFEGRVYGFIQIQKYIFIKKNMYACCVRLINFIRNLWNYVAIYNYIDHLWIRTRAVSQLAIEVIPCLNTKRLTNKRGIAGGIVIILFFCPSLSSVIWNLLEKDETVRFTSISRLGVLWGEAIPHNTTLYKTVKIIFSPNTYSCLISQQWNVIID